MDLLLGFFLLVLVAGWVASFSPVLALVLFVAVASGYLVGLQRQGDSDRAQAPPAVGIGGLDALDALDARLAVAPPIPLTDWVRVPAGEVEPLIEEIRAAVTGPDSAEQAEELAQLVLGGSPVPFTKQLRIHRRRAQKVVSLLRSGLV